MKETLNTRRLDMKKSDTQIRLNWRLDLRLSAPIDHQQAADMANRVLLAASVVTLTLGVVAALLLVGF